MAIDWGTLRNRLLSDSGLSQADSAAVIDAIMAGTFDPRTVKEFLEAWHARGETAAELAGAAESIRRRMRSVTTTRRPLVDTCGTGGDRSSTFNISTAAAIVTAACGVAVAKHGNRSVTSRTGSADVLEALGVEIDLEPAEVGRCIDEVGIGFCFAPRMHPAMRRVAPVRKEIPTPTIFNLIGPLANPAGAPYQLIGIGLPQRLPALAGAVARLGTTRTYLVRGRDGLDEVTSADATDVIEVRGTGEPHAFLWNPADFGCRAEPWDAACVASAAASATMIADVLRGASGVPRRLVLLNAAAALQLVDDRLPVEEHFRRAADAIDSGAAWNLLQDWIEASRS